MSKTTAPNTVAITTATTTTTTTATDTVTFTTGTVVTSNLFTTVPKPEDTQTGVKSRSNSPRRIKTTWIASLNKRELQSYLKEQGLDFVGTVEELRKRLSTFINGGQYPLETALRFIELEQRHTPGSSRVNNQVTQSLSQQSLTGEDELEDTPIIPHVDDRTFDRVRTWLVTFDGKTDPIDFIDRVEELACLQRIPLDQIPYTLSETFSGTALAWWRNRRHEWVGWLEFKRAFLKYFLPINFWDNLEDLVRKRQQMEGELFKDYALSLETLMRHMNLTSQQKLERIYKNCVPALRLLIKRAEFNSLDELTDLALHIEDSRGAAAQPQTPTINEVIANTQQVSLSNRPKPRLPPTQPNFNQNPPPVTTARFVNNPNTACHRCGQQGHDARSCNNNPIRFCWICGKVGIRTIECCRSGEQRLRGVTEGTENPANPYLKIQTMRCNGRSLVATISMGRQHWQGILDTGSYHSYINERTISHLPKAMKKQTPCNVYVTLANEQRQDITSSIEVTFKVGNTFHTAKLFVLPKSSDPFILGMDILATIGTTLYVGDSKIQVTTNEVATTTTPLTMVSVTTLNEEIQIKEFLEKELKLFENVSGISNLTPHKIIMRDDRPIKQRYYPCNPAQQTILNEKVDELLTNGYIEPSNSPYSAAVVLVRKKNTNQWRMCIDYRQLNEKSEPDAYPLPRIQHILDRLKNAKIFSTIDLKDGYWQIPMDPGSKKYTAFTIPGKGLFQWKVMPFGLHSAPASFQRGLDTVIGNDLEPNVFAYLDDIIIHTQSVEEHKRILGEVLRRLRDANLRINPDKCKFFQNKIRYLGHMVSNEGIHTDPDKISAIQALTAPTNIRELRRVLGIASWYRRFVPAFSETARPMTDLLKKGSTL